MKRYTLRMLIHDAKIFNQLRREYRRTKKNRRRHSPFDWLSRYLPALDTLQLSSYRRDTIIRQVAKELAARHRSTRRRRHAAAPS